MGAAPSVPLRGTHALPAAGAAEPGGSLGGGQGAGPGPPDPAEGTGREAAPTGPRPGNSDTGVKGGCVQATHRTRADSGHKKEAQSHHRQADKAGDRATPETPGATCPR